MSGQDEDTQTPGTSNTSGTNTISINTSSNNYVVAPSDLSINNIPIYTSIPQKPENDIWFNLADPVETFTGREQEILNLHEEIQKSRASEGKYNVLSQTFVITGLGGIGKTETVRMYICKYGKHYKHIIWIDAETNSVAESQFKKIASHLFCNEQISDFADLIEKVYGTLCQIPNIVLLVFDNAESMQETDGISKFLPKSLKPSCQKPTILITSRSRNWPAQKVITLDVWTYNESVQFIIKQLQLSETEESRQRALNLAELFGHFPLAIQTAVALIREQSEQNDLIDGKTYTIEDLIKDYNREKKVALTAAPGSSKTTMMTLWTVTIDKILKRPHGELALTILCTMSYLSPTCIPKEMLSYIFKEQGRNLSTAIMPLTTYCFVTNYKTYFTVHRLIQDVTIEHLKARSSNMPKNSNSSMYAMYPREDTIITKLTEQIKKYISELSIASKVYSDVADNLIYICNKISHSFESEQYLQFTLYAVEKIQDIRIQETLQILQQALIQQQQHHSSNQLLEFRIKGSIANVLLKAGQYEETHSMLTQVLDKQEKVLGVNHLLTLTTKQNIAQVLESQGQYEAALKMFTEVLDEKEKALRLNHPSTLITKNNIADVLKLQGKYEDAFQMFTKVLDEQEKELGVNDPLNLTTKNNIADVLKLQGKYEEALQMLKQVLDEKEKALGVNHPSILATRHNIAHILTSQGQYEAALNILTQVLEEQEKTLGVNHPTSLTTKHSIAEVLYSQEMYKMALSMVTQVLDKRGKSMEANTSTTSTTKHYMAKSFESQGQYEAALSMFIEVLNTQERVLGIRHPLTLTTKNNIAHILKSQGLYDTALSMLQEVHKEKEKVLGVNHPSTLTTKHNLADILQSQRLYEKALNLFKQVLCEQEKSLGVSHPSTLSTKHSIAKVLYSQEQHEEALCMFKQVLDDQEKVFGNKHLLTLTTKHNIAQILESQGQYEAALSMFTGILDVKEKELGIKHPSTLATKPNIAQILESQGQDKAAPSTHTEDPDKQEKILEVRYPSTAATKLNFDVLDTLNVGGSGNIVNVNMVVENQNRKLVVPDFIMFNVDDPVPSYAGQEEIIKNLHQKIENARNNALSGNLTVLSQIQVIAGMAGVGKTQLIRKYILLHKQEYDYVVWIDAEDHKIAQGCFSKLAEVELGIQLKDIYNKERSFKKLLKDIYYILCKKKCLIVFDNADSLEDNEPITQGISSFLPHSFPSSFILPKILVSSRNQEWREELILVNPFSVEESVKFSLNQLNCDSSSENTEWASQIGILNGNLPVLLQKAVAYMKAEMEKALYKGETFKISEFLDYYSHNREKMLHFKCKDANIPIKLIWTKIFDKIQLECDVAIKLLHFFTFLIGDNIPKRLIFLLFEDKSPDDVIDALFILIKYSIIQSSVDSISIHCVVQDVMREILRENGLINASNT